LKRFNRKFEDYSHNKKSNKVNSSYYIRIWHSTLMDIHTAIKCQHNPGRPTNDFVVQEWAFGTRAILAS